MRQIALTTLLLLPVFACTPHAEQEQELSFRGTNDTTYQLIMEYDSSGNMTTPCSVWVVHADMCCDIMDGSSFTDKACVEKVGSYCSRGWSLEDVCVVPAESPIYDETLCLGAPCGATNGDQECEWMNVLGDSGQWKFEYVCLDLAPPMGCGGGGDPYGEPCETGGN